MQRWCITVKGCKAKPAKRKGPWEEFHGEIKHRLPGHLSQGSHTGHALLLPQWVVTAHAKCYLPGKLIRVLAPRVLHGDWSHRHPLHGTYWNSRLPGGKQVFNISHTVDIDSLGILSCSYQFRRCWGPPPNPNSQRLTNDHLTSIFSKDDRQAFQVNSYADR